MTNHMIWKQPKSFLTNGIRKLVELHGDCVEEQESCSIHYTASVVNKRILPLPFDLPMYSTCSVQRDANSSGLLQLFDSGDKLLTAIHWMSAHTSDKLEQQCHHMSQPAGWTLQYQTQFQAAMTLVHVLYHCAATISGTENCCFDHDYTSLLTHPTRNAALLLNQGSLFQSSHFIRQTIIFVTLHHYCAACLGSGQSVEWVCLTQMNQKEVTTDSCEMN